MKFFLILPIIVVFMFTSIPFVSFSQTTTQPFDRNITLRMSPQIPAPGEQTTLYIESFLIDLNRSTVTWSIDGVIELRGVAERRFTFTAPDADSSKTITTSVTTPGGQSFANTYTVRPSNVDLLIEAETYTPPLYQGRSLFSHQSTVRAVAIPQIQEGGALIPPQNLLFTWSRDGVVLQNISGQGKNVVHFEGSIISRPFTITVTAETLSGSSKARNSILLFPAEAQLIVYENNPLFGNMFEKALSKPFDLDREEVDLTVIPYFFAVNNKNDGSIRYQWFENGTPLIFQIPSSEIKFTNENREKNGISEIAVSAQHEKSTLQNATIDFTLNVIGGNILNQQTPLRNATIF